MDGVSPVGENLLFTTDQNTAEQQVKDKVALIENDLPATSKTRHQKYDPQNQPILILSP